MFKDNIELRGFVEQDISFILPLYKTETSYFIYSNNYAKRQNIMKISNKSSAYRFDFVKNDYILTAYNGFKMFYEYNTGILKHFKYIQKKKPLALSARLKIRFNDVFIRFRDLIYMTASNLLYRNNVLKINARKQYYKLRSFHAQTRPLNKITFYKLFNNLNNISFTRPVYISYKFWRRTMYKIIIAGFTIKIKIHKKSLRKNLLYKKNYTSNKYRTLFKLFELKDKYSHKTKMYKLRNIKNKNKRTLFPLIKTSLKMFYHTRKKIARLGKKKYWGKKHADRDTVCYEVYSDFNFNRLYRRRLIKKMIVTNRPKALDISYKRKRNFLYDSSKKVKYIKRIKPFKQRKIRSQHFYRKNPIPLDHRFQGNLPYFFYKPKEQTRSFMRRIGSKYPFFRRYVKPRKRLKIYKKILQQFNKKVYAIKTKAFLHTKSSNKIFCHKQ